MCVWAISGLRLAIAQQQEPKNTHPIIIIVHYTTACCDKLLQLQACLSKPVKNECPDERGSCGLQSTKIGTFTLRDLKYWIWNPYSDSHPSLPSQERKRRNSCSLSILEGLPWHQVNIRSEGLWAWPQWSCLWANDEKRRFKGWLGTLHFFSSTNTHIKWQQASIGYYDIKPQYWTFGLYNASSCNSGGAMIFSATRYCITPAFQEL